MIEHEQLFQAIQNENWDFLILVLRENKKDISSDVLLIQAAKTFENVFLSKVADYPIEKQEIIIYLETLWIMDQGKYYMLDDDNKRKLICEIVRRKADRLVEAYSYAKLYPEEELCKSVIVKYESLIPQKIQHTQSDRINVTVNKSVVNVDYTINLFKSKQELQLFYALKKTFDTFQIYPNVAISCLLKWDLLKFDLTSDEKDYYFKGIVDFVVFDQVDGFKPLHFFELDSSFHDENKQKTKDEIKDSIFSKAGVRINRIRKLDKNVNETEFIKLIREILK